MRYAQGGGLTLERQTFREGLRLEAADLFAEGVSSAVVAKRLRVSERSVQRWRKAWRDGGRRALRSKGPMCRPQISPRQFKVLEAELLKGPVAHGWTDQTWTLARIQKVIGRRLHKVLSIAAVYQTMRRNGWSRQIPARRALERDDTAVAGWVKDVWPHVE
ncbi:winged helix-turn-helix domain-containing protein [Streptomyces sp. A0592]|uniref:winged helix-turn-helix domain-containing protein n=1 Tax=Streptomyces sp. A0592 TaxID=2563099 RepID=UPI00109E8014|nr:winged helix-turn-helix domain-containing protein [Streptomyces sp. A0592]THA81078.1 transposase [Streptomyces sp. A0592]